MINLHDASAMEPRNFTQYGRQYGRLPAAHVTNDCHELSPWHLEIDSEINEPIILKIRLHVRTTLRLPCNDSIAWSHLQRYTNQTLTSGSNNVTSCITTIARDDVFLAGF